MLVMEVRGARTEIKSRETMTMDDMSVHGLGPVDLGLCVPRQRIRFLRRCSIKMTTIRDDDLVEYECQHCGCETLFDLTTFDFEDDYLCPECLQPFFSEDDDDNSDDDEEDEPLD